ncbi:MAG: AsmA-like C-terminal region-containing protein, partial [Pseudomonadota bacterium]
RNPEFLLVADGQQLNLSRMGAAQDNEQAGDPMALEERLSSLQRFISTAPVPQMPGRVSVALPAVLAGNTTVRDVLMEAEPDGTSWKINRLEAKLPGRTQFLAAGQLGVGASMGFTGEVIVASNQPSGFASWLTDSVDPAIRRLDAAGMSARVDVSQQLQRFDDLEIAIGPATLNGRLERVVPNQGRPSLSLVLGGEEVDADALRALAGLVVGEDQESRLAGHDVSARLSTELFRIAGIEADGTDLSVRLKGGTLDIDRLTVGDLAGASISGVGRLENIFGGPVGDIDISLMTDDSTQLTALLSELGGAHPVLDHLRANADKFGETTIDVQTQFAPGTGDLTALSSRIRGRSGGSRINIVVDRDDAFAPLDSGQISVTADISSNNPRNLLAQLGVDSLPVEISGSAAVDMRLEGIPAEELGFTINYDAPDMLVSARGTGWQDVDRNLQGEFRFSLASDDLTPYLAMNGINVVDPGLPLPVDLETDIKTDAQQFQLSNLTGKAADADFSGNVTMTRNSEVADIKGVIELSQIDLAWIAELMVGPGTVLSGLETWSPAEFLPPLQDNLELDLELKAGAAQMHVGPTTGAFGANMVLKDNELQLRDIQAEWLGGTLSGAVTLANRDSSALLSGQVQLKDADLQPFMWVRNGFPIATGRLSLSASFESAGSSVRDVVGSFSGSGIIDMNGLELDGLENEALLAILASADADGFELEAENIRRLVSSVIASGKFFANEVSVPFTMAAGVLRMPNIVMTDTGSTVRGEARLDLADQDVDARFDVEFDPE